MSFKRRGYIKAAISTLICTPILFMNYDVANAESIERDYVRECEIIERTQPNENIDIDTFNVSRNIIENNIISYACNFLGTPYVYGANGPNSFDCSGFTKYIFESISIAVETYMQYCGYTDELLVFDSRLYEENVLYCSH